MLSGATALSREKLRAYTEFLKQQATELEAEIQLVRLHPRYAPLVADGPFGLPMVIDGPGEVERLDTIIEQSRSALERLSSNEALQEVRGAIREYRDSRLLGQQFEPVDDRVNESVSSGGGGVFGDVRPDLGEVLLGESGQPISHLRLLRASRTTARLDPLGKLPT
jgi:hypothetical protein